MQQIDDKADILIVDDNPDKIVALASVVEDLGNLIKARSGREALTQLLQRDFAVILLDVHMPEMDGFETATLIRTRERSENTPIIFITAISKTDEFAAKGYSLGAVDYIFSPVVPHVLRAKVKVFVDLFKMNKAVKRHAEELKRRLLQIEHLNAELAGVNKELEAFSYSVSHDLRAPLRSIDGFSGILLRKYEDVLDAQGKDYLHRVRGATERMGLLIDDLLQLSRLTRTEMSRRKADLTGLVRKILADLQESDPDRSVEVVIEDHVEADADERLVRVALENLLGNAWKFTGKESRARIEFGVTVHSGEPAYFVRDNGAGFDMAFADKIFGAFQRLHTVDEFAGTGIGLAIVQRIIRRHGGRIWAESEVDKGATFYFTLLGAGT
ncbi:MAG: ATP-binding protein [Pseudomonadota bacterium]